REAGSCGSHGFSEVIDFLSRLAGSCLEAFLARAGGLLCRLACPSGLLFHHPAGAATFTGRGSRLACAPVHVRSSAGVTSPPAAIALRTSASLVSRRRTPAPT